MCLASCVLPPSVLRHQSVQVRAHDIVCLHSHLSDARLLRPACDFRGGVQEASRCDARALHGGRNAGNPRVRAGLAALAVIRAARARRPLRVAHRERVLRAHREARSGDVHGQVGRADAEPAAGVDGREGRAVDVVAVRSRRKDGCVVCSLLSPVLPLDPRTLSVSRGSQDDVTGSRISIRLPCLQDAV